jgi:hypothetical protein
VQSVNNVEQEIPARVPIFKVDAMRCYSIVLIMAAAGHSPMSKLQLVVVVLCTLLYGLDGFDVLSISFAAPGIAREWGVDRAALGVVLSMELIGDLALSCSAAG